MAHRFEFSAAAARDLEHLCRHNTALLLAIVTDHIPAILADPLAVGQKKQGDLAHVRAYGVTVRRVACRLVYTVEGDLVTFIAIGPHDEAYARAAHGGVQPVRASPAAEPRRPRPLVGGAAMIPTSISINIFHI
jgi:mRNA-degrading endonuclease RelE of RelBE toxin-antitoxin system